MIQRDRIETWDGRCQFHWLFLVKFSWNKLFEIISVNRILEAVRMAAPTAGTHSYIANFVFQNLGAWDAPFLSTGEKTSLK